MTAAIALLDAEAAHLLFARIDETDKPHPNLATLARIDQAHAEIVAALEMITATR